MAIFVLVHGAFHGAWCWFKLVPELEDRGQRVVALDLPGAGDDPTPVETVTLDDCINRIVEIVSGESEPVFLLAHSLGGVPATAAAEKIPERLRRLVYLSAFIPKNGDAFADISTYPGYPEESRSPALRLFGGSPDDHRHPGLVRPRWYNDCSEADIEYAIARYKPVPTAS